MSEKPNPSVVWLKATRPFSFTASVTPVLIGAAFAFTTDLHIKWFLLPIFLLCAVIIHAATNLISDYVDFNKGVDCDYTFGSSGLLVRGVLQPKQIRRAAHTLFALALVTGFFIVRERGVGLLVLGLSGIAGGYFYTVSPVGYKYRALGDVFVFLFMGVFLVVGAFWALTGIVILEAVIVSLPISFLVSAILYANNVRDVKHDKLAGVLTLAGKLRFKTAKKIYYCFIISAYAISIGLVMIKIASVWLLLVLITLPKAIKNYRTMRGAVENRPEMLATLDVETAQLHLLFGLIFAFALALGGVL